MSGLPVGGRRGQRRAGALLAALLLTALLLVALSLLAPGCGPDYQARAVVRGRVTTGPGKKPLTTGSVMFYAKSGVTASATIDPRGNYELRDAPVGECAVTVTVGALPNDPSVRARLTRTGRGPKLPEMKAPEGVPLGPDLPSGPSVPTEVVPIDARYSSPGTSGLTFTVEKKGEQYTFDIDL